MTTEPPTRRRVLASVAAVAGVSLAGCNGLPWEEETATAVPASEAESILETDTPAFAYPAPVEPAAGALEDGVDRVDDLLDAVPEPLEAEDVPNGEVRQSIVTARDDALERRDDASAATGADRYHGLRETRSARDAAREAAATFRAIDDEALVDDLTEERGAVLESLETRIDELAYRGADTDDGRLRAALVAFDRESDLEHAERGLSRWTLDDTSTVLDVGDAAGDLEFALATDAVWDHLEERYEDDLTDPVDLESVLAEAVAASLEHAESAALPDRNRDDWLEETTEADLEDHPTLEHLLYDAIVPAYRARDRLEDAAEEGQYGIGVHSAVQFEREWRAFELVRDRLEAGDLAPPDSAAAVRAEREAAIDAAEAAIETIDGPSPGAAVLADTIQELDWIDDSIERLLERRPDGSLSLSDEYGDYVVCRAQFEALPNAIAAVHDRVLEA